MRAFISALLLTTAALPCRADAPDRLFIRPWTELEPLVRLGPGPYPIPLDVAEKTLLEQGRILVSGMIYGWDFSYTPSDKARRVEESFVLTPIAQVPWGSPRLRVMETEVTETRLWARIGYTLDEQESRRRAAWDSNTAALSTGQGTAALQEGAAARTKALEFAIRDAIRRSLDTRYLNKPREITGEIVLWTDPLMVVRSGTYTTTATVKLLVRDFIPYRIF
ncbi:MAG: hypothetical protein ABSG85_09310 [Spirochaetia bacterium]|jgi:hypothetical protein